MPDKYRLVCGSMELGKVEQKKRDSLLKEFCELYTFLNQRIGASKRADICRQPNFLEQTYSFGSIPELLTHNYGEVTKIESMKGVSQIVWQLFTGIGMQYPTFGYQISNEDWSACDRFKTDGGLQNTDESPKVVASKNQWHENRCEFYRNNQDKIDWSECEDEWLPNMEFSNELLQAEVEKLPTAERDGKSLTEAFHKGVMGRNGNIRADAVSYGSKICEANFYKPEPELSKKEKKSAGALRVIFSIVNSVGKKQYISLDMAHGMFEFHDEKGVHQGEFRYTGERTSVAETSHNLKSIHNS